MIDPGLIELLVGVARAAGPLLGELLSSLSEDAREAVIVALERDRAALDAAPSTVATIAEAVERHRRRVLAAEQARASTLAERYRVAPTTALALRNLADSNTLGVEERHEARIAERLVRAVLDGELVPALPRVLDAPVPPMGLFVEPDHEDD